MLRKIFLGAATVLVAAFVVIQFLPVFRVEANPTVTATPQWDTQTVALAERACFDCHSNETRWPWYSRVAPMSWLVAWDVREGRKELNFSVQGGMEEAGEAAETILNGSMPPRAYTLLHPEARLSAAEQDRLIQGLRAQPGVRTSGEEGESGESD